MIFIARYSFKVERKNEKFSRDVKFYECYKIVKYEKRSSNFSSYNSLIHYFAAFKENSSYSSLRIWDWGKKIAICSSYLVHSCKWWCGGCFRAFNNSCLRHWFHRCYQLYFMDIKFGVLSRSWSKIEESKFNVEWVTSDHNITRAKQLSAEPEPGIKFYLFQ